MKELKKLAQRKIRAWFAEFDARAWDRQIETDAKAGRLDPLISKALAEHKDGKTPEL